MITFLQKKLKDISISRKLYFTIGIMALLVSIELSTLYFSINTLSAVRSFVGGEGLWSKSEKDAVYQLRIYALSHNEKDYQIYREFLKVPLGDKKALLALHQANPDLAAARRGFFEGRNHPDDVDGMINLVMRFHKIYYINRIIVIWGQAEDGLDQIIAKGDKLHRLISSNTGRPDEINSLIAETDKLNGDLTKLEDEFSFTLGMGSRWLENIVLKLLLTLSLTIGSTGIIITISVSRSIEKGLKAIIDGAKLITGGLLNTRVKIYSRDEIGMLATSFNQMTDTLENNIQELRETEVKLKKEKERAELSEKAKQLFLVNMSHEIRTPMNAILGFARLLEESFKDTEQLEYIHIIRRSGDDLLVILNDILDFSRMDAGKITFERTQFSVRHIINTAVNIMAPKQGKKNLHIVSEVDGKVPDSLVGDSVRLNQVLLNLISNAIKFTEQGEINVLVNFIEEKNDAVTLEFTVKDTGIGIPFEKQAKIFESFEQAAADTNRKFGGTGLGLAIVKQLVELQGGIVSLKSEPGIGSAFGFRLSFLPAKSLAPAIEQARPFELALRDGKGIDVLIVEDNPINQLLVNKVLKKQGFITDIADNGILALDKFNKKDYHIILMDLQMPEMDGYETTQNIRKLSGIKSEVPIIAMTAHTIKGEKERCIEIGMNDFISKPFETAELYEKIFRVLKKG